MVRIPDRYMQCAFFLYPSMKDAEEGNASGASGFFTGIDWSCTDQRRHVYAVTNKHCITKAGEHLVIRATNRNGKLEFIETDPDRWKLSTTHDLAIWPIHYDTAPLFKSVSDGLFVDRDDFKDMPNQPHCLGPGDKVFMIGRFLPHDGAAENHVSARFGNLSMVAAPIRLPAGYTQESFAVDMRSISGYSGSPAFICWEFGGGHLQDIKRTPINSFLGLLGVDWGHIEIKLDVLDGLGHRLPDGHHVRSHASMAGVVPAWYLKELLDIPELKAQRMKDEGDADHALVSR